MNKKRLQELAGIKLTEMDDSYAEDTASTKDVSKSDTEVNKATSNFAQMAKTIFTNAELRAFNDAEPAKAAVTGDSIAEHAEKIIAEIRELVHEEIIKEYA